MSRGWQAASIAAGSVAGMIAGLVISRLAAGKLTTDAKANIVLASTLGGGALGAGVTAYATAPRLQLAA